MPVGTGRHIWTPGTLSVLGTGAPQPEEVIAATLTYGGLGTCQGGNIKLAQPSVSGARDRIWQVQLQNEGNVFAGILDHVTYNAGELLDVPLLAPHRQNLEGLGEQIGSPYHLSLQSFGITPAGVPFNKTMSEVLADMLDPYPNADYGVGPDLVPAVGQPVNASYVTYSVDERTYSLKNLGYAIPDYITDAVFSPGGDFQDYVYKRTVPDFIARKTGTVSANPTILQEVQPLILGMTKGRSDLADPGVPTSYENFFGTPPMDYPYSTWAYGTGQLAWIYSFYYPTNWSWIKYGTITLRGKFTVISVVPTRRAFTWNWGTGDVITYEMSQDDGTVLGFRLFAPAWNGQPEVTLGVQTMNPQAGTQGVFTGQFDIQPDPTWAGRPIEFQMYISQTRGHNVLMSMDGATGTVQTSRPNTDQLIYPAGWTAPFVTGPVFELLLPGWHIPPFRITNLPGGLDQMAVGSTVTYNKDECYTKVTTVAWPYEGQRRR